MWWKSIIHSYINYVLWRHSLLLLLSSNYFSIAYRKDQFVTAKFRRGGALKPRGGPGTTSRHILYHKVVSRWPALQPGIPRGKCRLFQLKSEVLTEDYRPLGNQWTRSAEIVCEIYCELYVHFPFRGRESTAFIRF